MQVEKYDTSEPSVRTTSITLVKIFDNLSRIFCDRDCDLDNGRDLSGDPLCRRSSFNKALNPPELNPIGPLQYSQ